MRAFVLSIPDVDSPFSGGGYSPFKAVLYARGQLDENFNKLFSTSVLSTDLNVLVLQLTYLCPTDPNFNNNVHLKISTSLIMCE